MNKPVSATWLRADQRERWLRGDRVPVEAYLEREPALQDDPEGVLDLIYSEVVLREEAGDAPRLDEYLERFPRFEAQLRLQFDVHRALEGDALESGDVRGSASREDDGSAPPAAAEEATAPGYEILGELGRGGMGVVYLARQVDLKRRVALKMILAGFHADSRERARFRTEAEAVARLQHPHIVQIYEVGDLDGRPFFSMELVDGGSLDRTIAGTPQPPTRAAQLVETLARAMDHVHRHGIIHRDLKPSNVLLTVDGVPKITDFGLAKLLDLGPGETPTDAFIGTPSYMAPEQASGQSRAIGPGSDVYALGAILYEMLTGRPPFRAETALDTALLVITQEPVAPTRLQPKVPRDLETICLKCLEKEPRRRYPDAGELADDLARFLAGEPIRARPISAWQRGVKWAKRRPSAAALVAVSGVATLALLSLGLWFDAVERHRLEGLRAEARQLISRGRVAFAAEDWQAARLHLASALAKLGPEPSLADAKAQVEPLLAVVNQRLADQGVADRRRARRRSFERWRDEVLFHGTMPVDVDAAVSMQRAESAAREALATVGLAIDTPEARALDPPLSPDEEAEIIPGCYELLLVLADALAQPLPSRVPGDHRGRVVRALRILDRAAGLRPPTRAYHLRRSRFLASLGDEPAAMREKERAASLQPDGAIDYFLAGVDSFLGSEGRSEPGALARAIDSFDHTLRLQPGHFWAGYYLAVCNLNSGRPDLAKAYLTTCLSRRPDFVWLYLLRGFALGKLREFPAAEADFQKASELGPNDDARYALLVNRAAIRFHQAKFAAAAVDLDRAIALKPDGYRAHLNLALLLKERKKYDEAVAELDRAVRLGPPAQVLADIRDERAQVLLLGGRYDEAARACDEILSTRPGDAEAHGVRAAALLELGDYGEAARSFDRYLARGGAPVPYAYRGRGLARMKLGDYEGALDDYTRALQFKPDGDLRAHRGWAYFFAGAPRLALRDFDEAVRLNPENGDAYVGRGLARVTLGLHREAVADAEEALRRAPLPPEMLHNVACIFAQAVGRVESEYDHSDRDSLASRYRGQAVATIRRALDRLPASRRGPFWRETVLPDSYLDPIRRSPEFRELEGRVKDDLAPTAP
jgi:eukaryotic-like serine/threonine-protein kinase